MFSQIRHVSYFNLADTIVCPINANWYNDVTMQLGDYGCMGCQGPSSVAGVYLGYKNTTTLQVGWIKISFDLDDQGVVTAPITASLPEILSPCVTTSVAPVPVNTGSGFDTCGAFTYYYSSYGLSCINRCDGNVYINNVSGGVSGYSYSWDGGTPQTIAYNFNLCYGTHMLTISDTAGNTCTSNFFIANPFPISFSLTYTNVACNGGLDGTVCCTNLVGGSAPYIFSWTPSSSFSFMSCVNNLPAGNYGLCVTDANNCPVCHTITVTESSPILVTESITQASCASCCDGISQLQISGGSPPYSTVYTNTPSCPGVYSYTVTDNNACMYVDSILISYPTSIAGKGFETMFEVFPNPSKGSFEIKNLSKGISIVKIKVLDVYEKCFFEKTTAFQNQEIELSLTIADGIYFLHVSEVDGTKEFVKKIIVRQ